LAAALALTGSIAWWVHHHRGGVRSSRKLADPSAIPATSANSLPQDAAHSTVGRSAVANLDELAQPWASKEFTFVDPATHQSAPAIAVHLPASPGHQDVYWAFSLMVPYSRCELKYVTDLDELATRYRYSAAHPMVVNQCAGTVYDLLRVGSTPVGALVRGEIVSGAGIRPPIAIELRVEGRYLFADRIE
jgi:hypothetical protein